MSVLFEARDLCKSYDSGSEKIEVLDHVNLAISSGEMAAIVGASGSGKTTLLQILGTLAQPTSGELYFNNKLLKSKDDTKMAAFRNNSLGFIFQFHHLLPEFSALENTMMPLLIRREPKEDAEAAARRLLIRVGLEDRLHHRVSQLSGGEQQRVALARALVPSPALLLADEPTGNLDKHNSEQVHELLWDLNRDMGMTLVVVTHSAALAAYMARRVTLSEGRLIEEE